MMAFAIPQGDRLIKFCLAQVVLIMIIAMKIIIGITIVIVS